MICPPGGLLTRVSVQVYWNALSRTYWVHWHMVEVQGGGSSSQAEKETQEKASTLTEALRLTAGKIRSHLKCPPVCTGPQEAWFFLCSLSEPDVLFQAPRWSLLSALPVRGSAPGEAGSESGRVVGDPLLHQEAGAQTAAGGLQHPAAESGGPGEEHPRGMLGN